MATRDMSSIAVWIPLDDADESNGCLWMYPGSHKSGVLWPLVNGQSALHPYTEEQAVPVPMRVGSAVFFHGHVLHRSSANLFDSGKRRRVLTSGYQSCESVCTYSGEQMRQIDP